MYSSISTTTNAPEFKATFFPPDDEHPPRMHLRIGDGLAVILTLPELRQLADVIADALQPVYEETVNGNS